MRERKNNTIIQEGLKIRMEKLKKSIETTHNEIEVEKQTNIDLLNMIFPQDIAKMLWRGNNTYLHLLYMLHYQVSIF